MPVFSAKKPRKKKTFRHRTVRARRAGESVRVKVATNQFFRILFAGFFFFCEILFFFQRFIIYISLLSRTLAIIPSRRKTRSPPTPGSL